MTSELVVDSLELLNHVPVGASVGVISGTVVLFEVSELSTVAKDEYLPLTCFTHSRSRLLYCACDPFLSCSCTVPAALFFKGVGAGQASQALVKPLFVCLQIHS